MKVLLKRLVSEEQGQGMVEYGLIIALVAVVLIGALVGLQGGLSEIFKDAENELRNPSTS